MTRGVLGLNDLTNTARLAASRPATPAHVAFRLRLSDYARTSWLRRGGACPGVRLRLWLRRDERSSRPQRPYQYGPACSFASRYAGTRRLQAPSFRLRPDMLATPWQASFSSFGRGGMLACPGVVLGLNDLTNTARLRLWLRRGRLRSRPSAENEAWCRRRDSHSARDNGEWALPRWR